MATIERGNWSFRDPSTDDIPDGSTINGGNFVQAIPDTEIMAGRTLTINGGNFTNVRQDPAWTINGGTWHQKSRCANLRPDWVTQGLLPAEVENCVHVVDFVDIVGGDRVYVYKEPVI